MKTSRCIFQTHHEESGDLILYNTFNGALLSFEPDYQHAVQTILCDPQNQLHSPEIYNLLLEEGFIVEDRYDEIAAVLERNRLGIQDSNRLDVIIMPNMNCNFSCVYCYEAHHKSGMEDQTIEQLLSWLHKMIPKFKAVLISWFGGEPLLSYQAIIKIQEQVQKWCIEYNVILHSHITTNGSLLSPDKASQLLSLGIHSYQITLDGPKEMHDSMRPLKGGGSSFDGIFENICSLAEMHPTPHIKLRVNYDERNIGSIKLLLQSVPEKIRHALTLVCEKIFTESFGVVIETMERGNDIEEIYQYARKLGFRPDNEAMEPNRFTFCYADRANQFTINYNGDIFKCTVQKFESKHRLGHLNQFGEIEWENNRLEKWMALPAFEEKCSACVFMPLCMGGCRKLRAVFGTVGDDCLAPFAGFDKKVQYYYDNSII